MNQARVITIDELLCLSRRNFCKTASVGVAAIALPACFGDGGQRVGFGGLDNTDAGTNTPPTDLANPPGEKLDFAGQPQPPEDFAMARQASPDLAQPPRGNCSGSPVSTGMKPNQFAMNSATYFNGQDAFVCRDAGGLFALSSICTHAGCTNNPSGSGFRCPCHGAMFSLQGDATRGPAFSPLDHYMTCLDNNGDVAFDPNNVIDPAARLSA